MRWMLFLVLTLPCIAAASGPQIFMAAAKKGVSTPATPTQNAASNSPGQYTASWGDVAGETSYTLYYSTSSSLTGTTYNGSTAYPGSPNATAGKITGITAGATGYTINGPLTAGVTYYTRISAVNGSGESSLSGVQSAAAAVEVPLQAPNAGFETALTTAPSPGVIPANWFPAITEVSAAVPATIFADRSASGEMTGSYVGRISIDSALSYDPGEDVYFGSGWSVAKLSFRVSKPTVDGSNGKITFDIRPKRTTGYGLAYLQLHAFDSGNNLIIQNPGPDYWALFGDTYLYGFLGSGIHETLRFTPTMNTTVTGMVVDVKSLITSILTSGKTWADVSWVEVTFNGVSYESTDGVIEYYIDNFR